MRSRYIISRLLAFIAAVVAAVAKEEDTLSSRLTASNYQSTVFHSGKNGIVQFYQSWCGHSIRFKPTWDQLVQEAHPSIFIAQVDCGASAENEICRSSHITTYPTLRYYLDGTEYDYTGSLSVEALREFIATTLVPPCNPIHDVLSCSERARKYAAKWLAKDVTKIVGETQRLEKMLEQSEATTTTELRMWMRERRDILKIIANVAEVEMDKPKRNEL